MVWGHPTFSIGGFFCIFPKVGKITYTIILLWWRYVTQKAKTEYAAVLHLPLHASHHEQLLFTLMLTLCKFNFVEHWTVWTECGIWVLNGGVGGLESAWHLLVRLLSNYIQKCFEKFEIWLASKINQIRIINQIE